MPLPDPQTFDAEEEPTRTYLQLEDRRSYCPLTSALELMGDKWTLIIIRDLMFSTKRSFNDFLDSPEKIATNILTDRLRKLTANGITRKYVYQDKPRRYAYELTDAGKALKPVLQELILWGVEHIDDSWVPPKEAFPRRARKRYNS